MNIQCSQTKLISDKCLLLVGGDGDTIEVFSQLSSKLATSLPNCHICTFDFTLESSSEESILDIQSKELEFVCDQLITRHSIKTINIWCTSRGAYSTCKLLVGGKFANIINHVIMYDPADYYISATDLHSWSGYQKYSPTSPVVSDELVQINSDVKIDVVHLTLRNHGQNGYLEAEYFNRGRDNPLGFPRLNTKMVKSFFSKLPLKNRGKYLEDPIVPHGFVRDGDINHEHDLIVSTIIKLLK